MVGFDPVKFADLADETRLPPERRRTCAWDYETSGSQPSRKGPIENFTGEVRVDPLFPVREPGRASAGSVTFEPGARTA